MEDLDHLRPVVFYQAFLTKNSSRCSQYLYVKPFQVPVSPWRIGEEEVMMNVVFILELRNKFFPEV